ncbi:hypothetical protein GCM10010428_06070 [Actinosynnema pretiosum subsp. pretiosum]
MWERFRLWLAEVGSAAGRVGSRPRHLADRLACVAGRSGVVGQWFRTLRVRGRMLQWRRLTLWTGPRRARVAWWTGWPVRLGASVLLDGGSARFACGDVEYSRPVVPEEAG